jgi:HrpA-like RNA helicase
MNQLKHSLEKLYQLGILDKNGQLTLDIGRIAVELPLDPHLSVVLINSGITYYI